MELQSNQPPTVVQQQGLPPADDVPPPPKPLPPPPINSRMAPSTHYLFQDAPFPTYAAPKHGNVIDSHPGRQNPDPHPGRQNLDPERIMPHRTTSNLAAYLTATDSKASAPPAAVSAPDPTPEATEAATAAVGSPAGFRRRRKLFSDSSDGPHPRTTAKIVARIAACKHWRRPLAHRLLPRFLPLFEQHAAAYFFKYDR